MSKKPHFDEQVYSAEMKSDSTGFCCGVIETGDYESQSYNRYYRTYNWNNAEQVLDLLEEEPDTYFKTLMEAWQNVLDIERLSNPNRPMIFTFVKYKHSKTFDEQELYDLVAAQSDHLFVHGFTNPGSGNYVEMWVLTNGSK